MAKLTGKPRQRQDSNEEEPRRVKPRQAPGSTIQSRENQIISLAYDLAEKRIRAGTATSQEVTHFLKMGSSQAQLEKAKLEHENKLLIAKAEAIQSQKVVEKLYSDAIKAFRTYSGQEETIDDDD